MGDDCTRLKWLIREVDRCERFIQGEEGVYLEAHTMIEGEPVEPMPGDDILACPHAAALSRELAKAQARAYRREIKRLAFAL